MKPTTRCLVMLWTMGILFGGCARDRDSAPTNLPEPRVETVLTQEEQNQLTPDRVVEMLKQGNQRFVSGTLTARDHSRQVRAAAVGQFPKAIVLSCVDSRVPVEDVFDRGIGDMFVARVAGNFENEDLLGSLEFATAVAGIGLGVNPFDEPNVTESKNNTGEVLAVYTAERSPLRDRWPKLLISHKSTFTNCSRVTRRCRSLSDGTLTLAGVGDAR